MTSHRVLIVDDDDGFRDALASAVRGRGYEVTCSPNGSAALAWLDGSECEVMLLDMCLPDMSGMEVLEAVRAKYPSVEVVILTGHGTIDGAIEAIRKGAFDFLTKPCSMDNVEVVLHRATERRELVERASILQNALSPPDTGDSFVGRSGAHKALLALINRVAPTDSSILILGETGVGKERVAKLLHSRSHRSHLPFVVVDCGSLHETLLQSELFGHEKGAYTGAVGLKHGLFEVADTGTIFLDEVGDIAPGTQVKLLRALETSRFRRLGGTKEIEVDIRVIAATNRDLTKLMAEGHFREDLYYRLSGILIEVPPLRERPDDIAALVGYHVGRFNERFGDEKQLSPEALQLLTSHDWPGNVRELMHAVEQAVILADSPIIGPMDLSRSLRVEKPTAAPGRLHSEVLPLRELEQQYVRYAMKQVSGHRSKAAAALGISERSLYRKLKLYSID